MKEFIEALDLPGLFNVFLLVLFIFGLGGMGGGD